MIICDLCDKAKDCLQKEIEGKEYDICSECWNQLAQKLSGKLASRRSPTDSDSGPRTPRCGSLLQVQSMQEKNLSLAVWHIRDVFLSLPEAHIRTLETSGILVRFP
jgi:hypothetical protein